MKDKESLIRGISGIFIILIMLSFIYSYNVIYDLIFVLMVGSIMSMEWNNMISNSKDKINKNKWCLIGSIYVVLILVPWCILKTLPDGNHLLMWLFIVVWSVDTFAYIVGGKLKLGKHKISKISPKKSYEGLIGGMLASMIFGYLFADAFLPDYKYLLLYFTPIFACLEQAGDFTESYLKRKFEIKDSGNIIPGHGGFLDRFDGFLYLTLCLLIMLSI